MEQIPGESDLELLLLRLPSSVRTEAGICRPLMCLIKGKTIPVQAQISLEGYRSLSPRILRQSAT